MVKMEWVIRANRDFISRAGAIDILVNMSGVVIDHDDDAVRLGGLTGVAVRAGLFQELTQPLNFLHIEFMAVRFLKERSLCANDKGEFIASMRFRGAKMLNQFNRLVPAQIARQLAVQKTPMQHIEIVSNMFTHLSRIVLLASKICSSLLIWPQPAKPNIVICRAVQYGSVVEALPCNALIAIFRQGTEIFLGYWERVQTVDARDDQDPNFSFHLPCNV